MRWTMKKRTTMRTLSLLPVILAIPCLGQQPATSTSAGGTKTPSVQACKLTPLSAATEGERIRVGWWSPACAVAKVRVYRRRQHIGEEAEIHPVVVSGTRNDTTIVLCWDSAFTELGIYEYRIVPMDSLGAEGPSSAWVAAHNLNSEAQPWMHSIHAQDLPGERAIKITWHLENAVRARGIVVHRAVRYDGPYERLAELPASDSSYTDRVQRVKETYFYRIEVIDVVGLSTVSMPVQGLSDAEPAAAAPTAVMVRADGKGVQLSWLHIGPDAAYYQVERGLPGSDAFVLVGDGIRADSSGAVSWNDSTTAGNTVLSYRVRTVSIGGIISEPSERVEVQTLDRRTPTSPTELAVRRMGAQGVIISWRDPWAGEPGAFHAVVERADEGSEVFTALHKTALDPGVTVFTDSTATLEHAYRYRVVGVTLDGTRGVPSPVALVAADASMQRAPRMLMARSTPKGIQLEWAAAARQGKGLNVYRAVDEGEPTLLGTVKVDADGHLDPSPRSGALNTYVVRLVLRDGSESEPSAPVSVRW